MQDSASILPPTTAQTTTIDHVDLSSEMEGHPAQAASGNHPGRFHANRCLNLTPRLVSRVGRPSLLALTVPCNGDLIVKKERDTDPLLAAQQRQPTVLTMKFCTAPPFKFHRLGDCYG